MLPHWLRHYSDMGFQKDNLLLVVHHRSNGEHNTNHVHES